MSYKTGLIVMPKTNSDSTKLKLKNEGSNVRMTFDIPYELKKAFKSKTVAEDCNIKEVLCRLVELYVDGKVEIKNSHTDK